MIDAACHWRVASARKLASAYVSDHHRSSCPVSQGSTINADRTGGTPAAPGARLCFRPFIAGFAAGDFARAGRFRGLLLLTSAETFSSFPPHVLMRASLQAEFGPPTSSTLLVAWCLSQSLSRRESFVLKICGIGRGRGGEGCPTAHPLLTIWMRVQIHQGIMPRGSFRTYISRCIVLCASSSFVETPAFLIVRRST